jgi:fused signal recognition particle receptor
MFEWMKKRKDAATAGQAVPDNADTAEAVPLWRRAGRAAAPGEAPVAAPAEPITQPAPVLDPDTPPPAGKTGTLADFRPPPSALAAIDDTPDVKEWLDRMRDGLALSSSRMSQGISAIFTRRKLDNAALEELEELLIQADLGPGTAARIVAGLAKTRFGKEITPDEVRDYLAAEIARIVTPVAVPFRLDETKKPHIVLMVGVNGTGKTTTIGKIARQYSDHGKTVWLAAGDTFRAAAVAQLQIWGDRAGCPVVTKDQGADAAALAYEAVEKARAAGADLLLIDTAGRLQNKQGLMEELRKIVRVIKKLEPGAPHSTLLTLDATTGQNAHSQVEIFRDMVGIDGLILTKLDGSARGGVVVALAEKFGLPVHAIGVGEGAYDLRPFDAADFARALVGAGVGAPAESKAG